MRKIPSFMIKCTQSNSRRKKNISDNRKLWGIPPVKNVFVIKDVVENTKEMKVMLVG